MFYSDLIVWNMHWIWFNLICFDLIWFDLIRLDWIEMNWILLDRVVYFFIEIRWNKLCPTILSCLVWDFIVFGVCQYVTALYLISAFLRISLTSDKKIFLLHIFTYFSENSFSCLRNNPHMWGVRASFFKCPTRYRFQLS